MNETTNPADLEAADVNTETGAELLAGMLDDDLNDIIDLPEYCVPPNGYYLLEILKVHAKVVKEKPAVVFDCKVVATLELQDDDDADDVVADGSLWGTMYFPLANEDSKAYMKRDLQQALTALEATRLTDVAQLEGRMVACNIKRRQGKKGTAQAGNIYTSWSNVSLMDEESLAALQQG